MANARKIVAIGPAEELLYLRSAGVEFVAMDWDADLEEALKEQARDPAVGLVIVSEPLAEGRLGIIAELRREHGTPVLVVPSHCGSAGTTLAHMKRALEQSLGVDLISKD